MATTTLAAPGINLPIGVYRAIFCVAEPLRLPPYPGSAWRGAFGHALKRTLCVTHEPVCADCRLFRNCGYSYIFETPPPLQTEKMRKYPAAPHPFVLHLDLQGGELKAGSTYELGITLVGHSNKQLPFIIHALEQAGAQGIGSGRGRFSLKRIEQYDTAASTYATIYIPGDRCEPFNIETPAIPQLPACARVILETPLRLKRDAGVVGVKDFAFGILFANLLRRLSMLTYFHTDTPMEVNFAALTRAAREVSHADANLHWFDWKRFSSRQKREMALGGLIGEFSLEGAAIELFWPYLWLGQYVHGGAATSMGLGRFRIEATASLPNLTRSGTFLENART